jgi:tRNA U34 2-thiouridine synthase MnmA/TrmU
MSGGVDSSCAALLLKREGHEVIGATMRLLDAPAGEDACGNRSCCSARDIEDARAACLRLDADFMVFNFAAAFWEEVVRPFRESYLVGMTPNPCILCNREMKFRRLRERAEILGCSKMATGHYARIARDGGRWLLLKALDADKDQSYVLYGMTQEELSGTLFPLGGLTKGEVRELCAQAGLPNARKPESQDICFVPDGDYARFIASDPEGPAGRWTASCPEGRGLPEDGGRYTAGEYRFEGDPGAGNDRHTPGGTATEGGTAPEGGTPSESGTRPECGTIAGRHRADGGRHAGFEGPTRTRTGWLPGPGDILSPDGRVIGRHKGFWRYTVGQRKGLGLPGPEPSYVLGIDPATNTVTVGRQADLATPSAIVGQLNLISIAELAGPMEVSCKIRYRQTEKPALLEPLADGRALVTFLAPLKAVAPGQAAVFYRGEVVVGGGTILGPGQP